MRGCEWPDISVTFWPAGFVNCAGFMLLLGRY